MKHTLEKNAEGRWYYRGHEIVKTPHNEYEVANFNGAAVTYQDTVQQAMEWIDANAQRAEPLKWDKKSAGLYKANGGEWTITNSAGLPGWLIVRRANGENNLEGTEATLKAAKAKVEKLRNA